MKKISVKILTALTVLGLFMSVTACGDKSKKTDSTTAAEVEEKVEDKKEEVADEKEAPKSAGINIYIRDASSGTREAFENIIGLDGNVADNALEASSNGDMAGKVGKDNDAIGYVSLTTNMKENHLKPLKYEGVEPSVETVISGDYQLTRPFSFVTRAKGDFGDDKTEQLIAAFIDYLTKSNEGKEIVLAAGGVTDLSTGVAWDELKANHKIVDEDNSGLTISTCGSTSVEKTLKAVLEAFQPEAGNFQIKMNQTGSGDGYKRTLGEEKDSANKSDIGFASRNFKSEEDVSAAMDSGEYCKDAVVVVVNEDNEEIEDAGKDILAAIFTGEVKTFSEK